ncbi:hypothetical protein ACOSP7_021992 [Xanthoceras sorbifolium]
MDEDKKTKDGNHSDSFDDDWISLSPTTTNNVEHFSDEYGGGMENTDNQLVRAGEGGYPVGASADWPSDMVFETNASVEEMQCLHAVKT